MEYGIREYKHYGECAVLTNGAIELIASLAFGPRVLFFGLHGHPNVLYEQPPDAHYLCSEAGWRVHGGLRLAFAPESENTYWPDNDPVECETLGNGVILTQARDDYLHVRKRIHIQFTDGPDTVSISFEIQNCGDAPLVGAPWAITAVRPGGVLRVPFFSDAMSMSPNRFISLWGDTSLADERLSFGDKELTVRQTPSERYFKLGVNCPDGTARYDVCGQSFTKRFAYDDSATYPDNNVNFEVYCCKHMMEIESLGALSVIPPGEKARHTERWSICHDSDDSASMANKINMGRLEK